MDSRQCHRRCKSKSRRFEKRVVVVVVSVVASVARVSQIEKKTSVRLVIERRTGPVADQAVEIAAVSSDP